MAIGKRSGVRERRAERDVRRRARAPAWARAGDGGAFEVLSRPSRSEQVTANRSLGARPESGVRHCRLVGDLAAHRRSRSRHRRDQRSRTLLFNIHTRDWDDELLRILKTPREILPRVVSSSEVVRETRRRNSDRRDRRRSAGRAVRSALHRSRHGKEHLWDGLLHRDAYRRSRREIAAWVVRDAGH